MPSKHSGVSTLAKAHLRQAYEREGIRDLTALAARLQQVEPGRRFTTSQVARALGEMNGHAGFVYHGEGNGAAAQQSASRPPTAFPEGHRGLTSDAKRAMFQGYCNPQILPNSDTFYGSLAMYIQQNTPGHESYEGEQLRNALRYANGKNGFVFQGAPSTWGSAYVPQAAPVNEPRPTVFDLPALSAQPAYNPPVDPYVAPPENLYVARDGQRLYHTEVRRHPRGGFVDADGNAVDTYHPVQS
ncbi:hypothetical protein JCM8547_005887 [Rhodosporidiobolus lusitaniae]